MGILIKETTREERERTVAESIGNINGACDGCMAGLADMYQDYIDGKREMVYFYDLYKNCINRPQLEDNSEKTNYPQPGDDLRSDIFMIPSFL